MELNMHTHFITRTFHPVGQGGFYSERHNNFNIVYDCGSMSTSVCGEEVKSAFNKDKDIIDVLFISHFDFDHVSGIKQLMLSTKSIKNVVLPLLHENQATLLTNINRSISHNILTLINQPELFFGEDTNIIYVKASENNNNDNLERNEKLNIANIPNKNNGKKIIESGSILTVEHNYNWLFIPYNYRDNKRASDLNKKLTSAGFDVTQLLNEPLYTVNNIISAEDRTKLKKIYVSIDGNINENSMLVYSGPEDLKNKEQAFSYVNLKDLKYEVDFVEHNAACIYTGDSDLNKINLNIVYSSYIQFVGAVQIPHHGSRLSFKIDSVRNFYSPLICPISYGRKNSHGHPSAEVINTLSSASLNPHVKEDYKVILVNEEHTSKFIQYIYGYTKKNLKLMNIIKDFKYGS